jgi:hypothetical protein
MTVFNVGYSDIQEAFGDMSGRKKKKKTPAQDPVCDLYEMKGNSSAYGETDLINYTYDKSRNQRTVNAEPVTKKATVNSIDEVFETKDLPKSLFEKQFEIKHPNDFEVEDPKEYMVRTCTPSKTNDDKDDVYDDEVVRHKQLRGVAQESEYQEYIHPGVYDETPVHSPRVSHERRREKFYYDSEVEDEEPVRPQRKQKPRQRRVYQEEDTDMESEYEYRSRPQRRYQQKHVYLDIILYVISGIILIFLLEQFVRIGINMQSI